MKRLLTALFLAVLATACGSSSPTAPTTAATTTATKIITVSGSLAFGTVNVGQTADRTFTIANSGTATLTFTAFNASGGTGNAGFTATATTGTVAPGATVTVTVHFAPTIAQFYSCVLSVVGDQTGGGAAINVSGTGVSPVATNIVLNGTVTDGTSHGILPNITVQIVSGTNAGQSAVTDGSGTYTFNGLTAGTFTLSAAATSYTTTTQPVTLTASTRVDLVLQRSGTAPPPPPPGGGSVAAVEYRITGNARRCSATYQNSSGGTNQSEVNIPFSYTFPSARSGDFLYMSCQIDTGGDSGSITIGLYKNGNLVQTATANGFPNIATVSGSY